MKSAIFLTLSSILLFSFGSCKKTIERLQENAIVNAMTDGQWVITNFVDDGVNLTSDYSTYKFQYYSDRTVDAFNNGTVEKKGNWDGDVNAETIWANFSSASNPLLRLNGTWHVVNNSWTFVELTQTNAGVTRTMRLEKL